MGISAKTILSPESPHHQESLLNDLPGHFRAALKTVRENDGHFRDMQSLPPDLMRHFDLKAVSIRTHILQVQRLESLFSEAFEAASRIREGHPGDNSNILCGH